MMTPPPKDTWKGKSIHMVGVKGTGMAALAELLAASGARVRGSDVAEKFFTDEILDAVGIPYAETFDSAHLDPQPDLVVHSAAYFPESNPELVEATRRGLPVLVYPEALGAFSGGFPAAAGISGVHGKTTTTALAGVVARALNLPAAVLAGSLVPDFGNRATLNLGSELFIAETCEYKRHFLHFHPSAILVTSIELDHTDYFQDYDDIFRAFFEYGQKLPPGGLLVYCADEPGALSLTSALRQSRPDLRFVPYGLRAEGEFRVVDRRFAPGESRFRLAGFGPELALRIPGTHNVLNAAGACALVFSLANRQITDGDLGPVGAALASFRGSRRRSQIVGEVGGILVMDDYGHHPTAVDLTLKGLRDFYPDRRIVVDFMSHTYSRTKALMNEFAGSFSAADEVVLHKIYASARETETLGIDGRTLFEATRKVHPRVSYFDEVLDAVPYYKETLRSGDLLVTMGAGDNWKAGTAFLKSKGA
ncbi:MAG TPA: UDP-N-acetylmuramate--L-alanine ligase [Spirochaetia bacterium]|nr:UDP-N-acetylmuramate--L-alanine ligase [Spirochaetia bacterium]